MATNTTVNGRNYYRITRTVNGKRKQFYGKTRSDAENKYIEYIKTTVTDACTTACVPDRATFGALMDDYVDNVLSVSNKYTHGTIGRYESVYKTHIRGKPITKLPMSEITSQDIQRFYNGLNVSQQTMKAVHKFMSAYFKWAVVSGYANDVLSAVEIPRKYDNSKYDDVVIWTDDEVSAIIEWLEKPPPRFRATLMVKMLLYTGMRISEVLCLRYPDIRDGVIHVNKQYYLGEIKEPKWGSRRKIPIHAELEKAMQKHIEWQKNDMAKHGYRTDYIFTTSTGKLYCASSVRKMLVSMCKNIGIPYKDVHTYRRTFCTKLCRCGVPLEIASKMMGHKNISVTASHYTFVEDFDKKNAIEMLNF